MAGIIDRTGTPVDRTVIVSLEAIEAIHVDWQSGAQSPGQSTPVEQIHQMDLSPSAVTAALVGVKSRLQIFGLQGILPHDESSMAARQPPSTGIRTDWTGKTVQPWGFIVPLDHEGTGVTAFILVPYVGACVHVPPPPANQLVFVTTRTLF